MAAGLAYQERNFACFYDWQFASRTQDIPMYLDLTKRYGAPVLELCAGTGRITIPLARAGYEVVALDLSSEMLRLLKRKLRAEPVEVRRRVQIIHGDMTDFALDRSMCVAFVPFSSFFHMHTDEQRLACLNSVYRALSPGGVFTIDTSPHYVLEGQRKTETPEEIHCEINPETGLLTQELHQRLRHNKRTRCTTCEHTFVEHLASGRTRTYKFVQEYSWITPRQMLPLFKKAGFSGVKVCGGYGPAAV